MPNQREAEKNLLDKFAAASQKPAPELAAEAALSSTRNCFRHPERAGSHFCAVCVNWRCPECVRIFEGVAVCPDSDSLCQSAAQYDAVNETIVKASIPYSQALLRALTFPLRHFLATTIISLLVWYSSAAVDALTDVANTPPLLKIMAGARVGFVGTTIAYMLLAVLSTQYLINRVNGKEQLRPANIWELGDLLEPFALWLAVGALAFIPVIFYAGFHQFQVAAMFVFSGNSYERQLSQSLPIKFYLLTFIFAIWAVVIYPMGMLVLGLQRNVFQIFNPRAYQAAWLELKAYLPPVFAIAGVTHLLAIAVFLIFGNRAYGLAMISFAFTIATLISAVAFGAAIERACEHRDEDQQ